MSQNPLLAELLANSASMPDEETMQDAFVKQASAEGIDLNSLSDEDVLDLYENTFKPEFLKQAAAQAQPETADGIIQQAAMAGADDAVLDRLALSKLAGYAQFEGFREAWEKAAQEMAEAAPAEEAAPEAAPEAATVTEEEAKAIVEDAASEAVEEVAEAMPEAPPEEVAAAAAEVVPEKVEEKVSSLLAWKNQKLAAVSILKEALSSSELKDVYEAFHGRLKDEPKTLEIISKAYSKGPTKADIREVANLKRRITRAYKKTPFAKPSLRARTLGFIRSRGGKAALIGAGTALAGLGGLAAYRAAKKKGTAQKKAAALNLVTKTMKKMAALDMVREALRSSD